MPSRMRGALERKELAAQVGALVGCTGADADSEPNASGSGPATVDCGVAIDVSDPDRAPDHRTTRPASSAPCTFELLLADGSRIATKRVVCAMGPGPAFKGMRATLPWWADDLAASLAAAPHAASAASRQRVNPPSTHRVSPPRRVPSLAWSRRRSA